MLGALSRTARTPRMPPRMRRGFAGGGGTDQGEWDQAAGAGSPGMGAPMVVDPGSGQYIPPADLPAVGPLAQNQQPPQNQLVGPMSGSPDPNAAGKMQAIQGGINTLKNRQDMENATSILAAGGMGRLQDSSNLPLLAAAGALLSPTRTGTVGESLGKAMTEGAGVAEQERKRMEDAALRMQQAIWQNDYRQQMGAAATSRANTYQGIGAARQEGADAQMLRAQTGAATAQERLALAQANAAERAGKGTWQATEGPDPDNPGQKIPGMAFLPTGGGQPTFFPTVVQSRAQVAQQNADTAAGRLPIAQQNADANTTRAATGQENTGLRRQALANAADINERRLIETSTDAQLREANSYISAHTQKDVNGNITKQPKMGEALAAIQGARGAAQPPAVAAPTAPRTVAPPTVQAPIPPGLPPNAKQAPNGEWYVPNPSGSGWLHATPNVGAGGT